MNNFKIGIVGYPLSHTISPLLHTIFLELAGKSGSFEKFQISPKDFPDWVNGISSLCLHGFNVTIPYKILIIPYLSSLSEDARLIGSVNTVICKGNKLIGENTDQFGFSASLDSDIIDKLPHGNILVLGAGGSSRSIAYALLQKGIDKITFLVRDIERARPTIEKTGEMNQCIRQGEVAVRCVSAISLDDMRFFDGVVNTTPVGMSSGSVEETPLSQDYLAKLPSHAFVYDLIYNPSETKLLKNADILGLKTVNGLNMLIYQGVKSFEYWTNIIIPGQSLELAWKEIVKLLNDSLIK